MNNESKLNLPDVFQRLCVPALRERLNRASSVEDAGRAVSDALAPLVDPEGEAIGSLPRLHGEPVRSLLSLILEACDLLRTSTTSTNQASAPEPPRSQPPWLIAAGSSAIVSAIATKVIAWSLSPAVGISAGLAAGYAASRLEPAGARTTTQAQTSGIRIAPADVIVSKLSEIMQHAQRLAQQRLLVEPHPEHAIHENAELMELLQRLLGKSADANTHVSAQGRKLIEGFLWRHEVTAHWFEPGSIGPDSPASRWLFEEAAGETSTETLAPLLCHKGKVVRQGKVLLAEAAVHQVQKGSQP